MLMAIFLGGAPRKDYLFMNVRLSMVGYGISTTLVVSYLNVQMYSSISSNTSFPIRIYFMIVLAGSSAQVGSRPTGRVGSFPLQCVQSASLRPQLFLIGDSRIG
jgi:hypothetical protein